MERGYMSRQSRQALTLMTALPKSEPKIHFDGQLERLSALPVLTDQNVRSAPVLESHAI
jgi:hypothetical protein